MQEGKLIKWANYRAKNKRITIGVFHIEAENDLSVVVATSMLIGSWKDRKIQRTNVVYGLETFSFIYQIFDKLNNDSDFMKIANRTYGQIVNNKYKATTNID